MIDIRIPLQMILAGIALLLFSSCGDTNAGDEKEEVATTDPPVPVQLEEVTPRSFTETIQLTGVVKAYEDVMISPEEGGILRAWMVSKGQRVKKGDTIAFLNDDVTKPAYEAAVAAYNTAELNFEKQESVYREQAISELQFKTSRYNRDAARAQKDLAEARLIRTRITSPIAGILDDRQVEEGEFAVPSFPVGRVVNIDRVKLLINIPERYAGTITLGTPVEFSVIAYDQQLFHGTINFVGSVISPDNRTFPVEVHLRNPGRILKPEMIARVKVAQSVARKAILVSENVIQQLDQGKYVVYVSENGLARQREVKLGAREESKVEILDGLHAGEQLIVSGFQNVTEGQRLAITE